MTKYPDWELHIILWPCCSSDLPIFGHVLFSLPNRTQNGSPSPIFQNYVWSSMWFPFWYVLNFDLCANHLTVERTLWLHCCSTSEIKTQQPTGCQTLSWPKLFLSRYSDLKFCMSSSFHILNGWCHWFLHTNSVTSWTMDTQTQENYWKWHTFLVFIEVMWMKAASTGGKYADSLINDMNSSSLSRLLNSGKSAPDELHKSRAFVQDVSFIFRVR